MLFFTCACGQISFAAQLLGAVEVAFRLVWSVLALLPGASGSSVKFAVLCTVEDGLTSLIGFLSCASLLQASGCGEAEFAPSVLCYCAHIARFCSFLQENTASRAGELQAQRKSRGNPKQKKL